MVSCPCCGNMFGITSESNEINYCSICKRYFKNPTYFTITNTQLTTSNVSTADIENNINIYHIPDVANDSKDFYCVKDDINLWQPEENELTINSKEISIKTIR